MLEIVKSVSALVATCCEFTAVVVIVVGALQALGSMVKTLIENSHFATLSFWRVRGLVGPGAGISIGCRYIANSNQSHLE
jgi:hypothetical protein